MQLAEPEARTRRELRALLREAERRGLLEPDYLAWLKRARPEFRWDADHFLCMQERLNRVTQGELLRVVFNVAVRHGKTEHNTIGYAAYRLELDPAVRIVIVTHGQPQARHLSRKIRRIYTDRGGKIGDVDTVDEWETPLQGGIRCFGVGAGTASVNADLIIIDDPIANRAKAESKAHRDRVWDSLTGDILARAEPHTQALFSMPRWHEDDPAGRLRERHPGQWEVVDLPGRAEEDDPLGREPGEPLWPEHRGEQWLKRQYIELGAYNWASLMQGRPRPREGGLFEWEWWGEIDTRPEGIRWVRYWDTAGTELTGENDPDYTAGALVGRMHDDRTVIWEVVRRQASVAERDSWMAELAREDRKQFGSSVRWWIETETGIGGRERMQHLVRLLQNQGISVQLDPRPQSKKPDRAQPLASKAEAGNVVLGPGEWRDAFRLEAADFPGGVHDDQIDAAIGADAKLSAPVNSGAVQTMYV